MKEAFTLVETLLYFALVGIVMLSIATFLSAIIATQSKNEAIFEVDQQATLAMQRITETIRNAEGINSPTLGNSGSTLSLQMANGAENPTTYTLSGNTIEVTIGASPVQLLTTNTVIVDNVVFTNLTPAANTEANTVRIAITLSYNSNTNIAEDNYTQTYYSTATIRE